MGANNTIKYRRKYCDGEMICDIIISLVPLKGMESDFLNGQWYPCMLRVIIIYTDESEA